MRTGFSLFLIVSLFLPNAQAAPLWIAVGYHGRRLASPDALHWREVPSSNAAPLLAIACDGSRFVACGGTAAASVTLSTTDGEHWREWGSAPGEIAAITAGEGRIVALRGGRLLAATMEERFTEGEALPFAGEVHSRQIACGDTEAGYRYVAIGEVESASGPVCWRALTDDGLNWSHTARGTAPARALVHGAGIFVVAGPNSLLETSHDGEVWTRRALAEPDDLDSLIWNGGEFIAQGRHLHTSRDGFTWQVESAAVPGPLLWAGSHHPLLALSWSQILMARIDKLWKPVALPPGAAVTAIAARLESAAMIVH